MEQLPLYHRTARDGRAGIPSWWFGAPIIAFVYAFLTPRIGLDIVTVPETLPNGMTAAMRWLVGLLLGVALISTWRVIRFVAKRT
jgi:hypothetical protein